MVTFVPSLPVKRQIKEPFIKELAYGSSLWRDSNSYV